MKGQDTEIFLNIPLQNYGHYVCVQLINYVSRVKKHEILENAAFVGILKIL